MKLQQFNKNIFTLKNTIIFLIVVLICLITSFIIYKSHAKYYKAYSDDVLKSKVGEFSNSDIILAWTLNGDKKTDAFPTSSSGYDVDSVICENGVTASWDSTNWGLININSNGQNKIDCTINFVKDDYKGKKCIRATELHTDGTHTYGNLGTVGTLASGDAFDCDIDGDDIVDDNERFYYVSTKTNGITQDANTAVLIYYNHYVTSPVAWASKVDYIASGGTETDYGSNGNDNKGPVTAIKNLPTINDWNTTLTSTTRNITTEKNAVKVSNFQYKKDGTDLAARLLTVQELQSACNITVGTYNTGELDGCNYLMENTKYSKTANPTFGTWLETAPSSYSSLAWNVDGFPRCVSASNVYLSSHYGARPAIEVAKTDIDY